MLDAQEAVEDYYTAIDNFKYLAAWRYLGTPQRAENIDFVTWRSGYDSNIETNLQSAVPVRIDRKTALVEVRVNTLDVDACENDVRQTFEGTWTVKPVAGDPLLMEANIEKVTGDDPVTDASNCPQPAQPPPPAPAAPAEPDCDPNYPDVCLAPYDGFDRYNCTSGGLAPEVAPPYLRVLEDDPYGLDGPVGPTTSGIPGVGCENP